MREIRTSGLMSGLGNGTALCVSTRAQPRLYRHGTQECVRHGILAAHAAFADELVALQGGGDLKRQRRLV
jgi:hypothetical protein